MIPVYCNNEVCACLLRVCMKAVQDVRAQLIMIHLQSGVIRVVNASHRVHQTVSALLSANVCCIFEHLNICINACFVCSGLTLCGLIAYYTVSQKKLGHFNFYCNFGKCGPISIILSLLDS